MPEEESIDDLIEQATKMAAYFRAHPDDAAKAGFTMETIEKLERATAELIQEKRRQEEIEAKMAANAAAQNAGYIRLTAELTKAGTPGARGAHGKNWVPVVIPRRH